MGLYAVAMFVGRELAIHTLAVEAHALRRDYMRKLAALRGELEEEEESAPNFEYVEEGAGVPEAVEVAEPVEALPAKKAA